MIGVTEWSEPWGDDHRKEHYLREDGTWGERIVPAK